MGRPIFLSVGRSESPDEKEFIAKLRALLEARGLELRTAGGQLENPIAEITDIINACDGVIAIVFERVRAKQAVEFPEARNAKVPIGELRLPTVWNHIEAAIGRARQRQVLMFIQEGCRREGMVQYSRAYPIRFEMAALADPALHKAIDNWIERLGPAGAKKHATDNLGPPKKPFDVLLEFLTSSWGKLILSAGGLIASVFGVGFVVGWKLGPQLGPLFFK